MMSMGRLVASLVMLLSAATSPLAFNRFVDGKSGLTVNCESCVDVGFLQMIKTSVLRTDEQGYVVADIHLFDEERPCAFAFTLIDCAR